MLLSPALDGEGGGGGEQAGDGECDEEALENALRTDAAYVAFVASKTKAAKVLEYLGERGVSAERLKQVKAPAGMDIGASSPEEMHERMAKDVAKWREVIEKAGIPKQ